MVITLLLVVVTIIKGFKVEENPLFIFIESVLNIVLIADFLCRLRLIGCSRFFGPQTSTQGSGSSRVWNWFDAIVVVGSFLMFLIILFSHATVPSEDSEDGEQKGPR